MNVKYATLIAMLLCSATITGCIGDDSEERIEQLEGEANERKGMMESLNALQSEGGLQYAPPMRL